MGHEIVDLAAQHLYAARSRAPYRPMPQDVQHVITNALLPSHGASGKTLLGFFQDYILPYPTFGYGHPQSFGWVGGGAEPIGVLADFLAAILNPNCIGGDQSATLIELTTLQWLQELLGFSGSGLFTSGGSQATAHCLAVARQNVFSHVRSDGLYAHAPLILYASDQVHHSVIVAMEYLGMGNENIRIIPSTQTYQIDVEKLGSMILEDRENGLVPFCVVANVGTTNTGALDPLEKLADICFQHSLWLHLDGAYGAFGKLDPTVEHQYVGFDRANSLAVDPHKWLAVPYDCGCAFVKDERELHATFASDTNAPYLNRIPEDIHFSDRGPQLSRSFRALKVWMTLLHLGSEGVVERVTRHNALARFLAVMVESSLDCEMVAPTTLSTVCFRIIPHHIRGDVKIDEYNRRVMQQVQDSGDTFLSGTTLHDGRFALRACILHPDTTGEDVKLLFQTVRNVVISMQEY